MTCCDSGPPPGGAVDDDCSSGRFQILLRLEPRQRSNRVLSSPRGTAAIGPLIAALKDGRSVSYEGRQVLPVPPL